MLRVQESPRAGGISANLAPALLVPSYHLSGPRGLYLGTVPCIILALARLKMF